MVKEHVSGSCKLAGHALLPLLGPDNSSSSPAPRSLRVCTRGVAMAGSYEKVAEAAMAELDGHMCWPVEWFKEDLPDTQLSAGRRQTRQKAV